SGEDGEERVTLGVDLGAFALGDRFSQDSAMVGEDGVVSVTKGFQELRGAFDVGEEERDIPSREGHGNGWARRLHPISPRARPARVRSDSRPGRGNGQIRPFPSRRSWE